MRTQRNTRILWVTLGDENVASTRVRVMELAHGLQKWSVDSVVIRGTGLRGRIRVALRAILGRNDVIVLQKVLYGRLMLGLVRIMTRSLVFECDDAIYLPDSQGEMYTTRSGGRRLTRLLARADVITTTNDLLEEDLAPATGRSVVFAGPAPPVRRPVKSKNTVLWLGSPSTSAELDEIGTLPETLRARGIECVAIGADPKRTDLGWTVLEWTAEVAEEWLERAKVGLMPLSRTPWNDRKAGYKILQYAANGVVPIASDGPPARRLLSPEMDECLVTRSSGWEPAIESGLAGAERYAPMLDMIVARNSVDSAAERWFHEIVEKGG